MLLKYIQDSEFYMKNNNTNQFNDCCLIDEKNNKTTSHKNVCNAYTTTNRM